MESTAACHVHHLPQNVGAVMNMATHPDFDTHPWLAAGVDAECLLFNVDVTGKWYASYSTLIFVLSILYDIWTVYIHSLV